MLIFKKILKVIPHSGGNGNDPEVGGDAGGGRSLLANNKNKVHLLIMGFSIILSSCSIKKKEDPSQFTRQLESLKTAPDSDNDGISDSLEIATDTNPLIADIPKLSIALVKDISVSGIFGAKVDSYSGNQFITLKQEFSEVDDIKGGDIDFLKVLRRKVIINQYNHLRNVKTEKNDIITTEDLRANILSKWDDSHYFDIMDSLPDESEISENSSGKFTSNFRVKLSNIKNVTEISDIGIKSFFYNYEKMSESEIYNHYLLKESGSKERFKLTGIDTFLPVTSYPLIANEISTADIYSQIKDRSEVGLKFSDYSYIMTGISLNYAEVISKVLDGDAKVIFSDGKKTEVYFIAPSLTIEEALIQKGHLIKLNNFNDIYSINGIETTAKYPMDLDDLKIDDFKRGIWSVFGDADTLLEKVKPQGLYAVSYSTIGEILNSSKKWTNVVDKEFTNYLTLDNIYEGDELLLNLENTSTIFLSESISNTKDPELCTGGGCNLVEPDRRGPSCTCSPGCSRSTSTPSVIASNVDSNTSDIAKWLSFKDSYGEVVNAKVYKYGKNIKVKFVSLPNHLKNKIIVTLKNPNNLISSARAGVISSSCGPPSYNIQTYENQFKIAGTVKVFGINKY